MKTFDPVTLSWNEEPDLQDYRWYPSIVPLPNGELLAIGGGGLDDPVRTNTSELYDPNTGSGGSPATPQSATRCR